MSQGPWILDQEDLIADPDTDSFRSYHHAEREDLELEVYFCDDEEIEPRVTYNVVIQCVDLFIDVVCERMTDVLDPEYHDPNTSVFVANNIAPLAEKVLAFLERFPGLERYSPNCLICGVDIHQTSFPTNHMTAFRSYQHFRDHHLGNSTVKSALKQ